MYTSSAGYNIGIGRNEGHIQDHLRDAYEPLMVKYGVDLGVWGHVHVVSRARMCMQRNRMLCNHTHSLAPAV